MRASFVSTVVVALCACSPAAVKGGNAPEVAAAVAKTRSAHPELFRRKVILLGFDSCDPDLVDELVRQGKCPHFAQLMREGAHGAMASIQPILSPLVWTTIATGMSPQRHGILDFVTNTPAGQVPVTSEMRQADTVWELLSKQGEDVGVVGWLVSWPADKVNGFLVTDRMGHLAYEYIWGAPKTADRRTWPESLTAELAPEMVDAKDVDYAKIRPFLDISQAEYDASYSASFDPRNRVGNLRLILATAESFRNIGERLYAEKRPRFFASYFEAMDAISHLYMPFAPPKSSNVPTDLYLKYRDAIEANYIWHDRVLGEYMDQCDADTTLFVVSDHGFKNGDFRTADKSDFHEKTGAAWHRRYGVFYAWGDGVKRGANVPGASVYDVTPTILAAMGYPVPEDMTENGGKVLVDAFEGGLPFETVPTYRGDARRDEVAKIKLAQGERKARSPDEEDELRKLQSLGYIGGESMDAKGDPVSARLNLGWNQWSQGRPELAYQTFKKVLDDGNRLPMVLDAVAEGALRTGRFEEAETYVAESLVKEPQGFAPMIQRAKLLLARKKFDEAEKAARDVVAKKPDLPQSWGVLALVLQKRLDDAEARKDVAAAARIRKSIIETYEKALRLEPRQADNLFELARMRLQASIEVKEVEKARDELKRVIEMNPRHVNAYNNLAIAYLRLGIQEMIARREEDADRDLRTALANAEKAVTIASDVYGPEYRGYAKGYANKAYALWKLGRLDDAAVAAGRAREIEPSYVLNSDFAAVMTAAGHPFPPPPAKSP